MARWIQIALAIVIVLVVAVIARVVLRARRRRVRRAVIDDQLDVPERPSIAERLATEPDQPPAADMVACVTCGTEQSAAFGIRSASPDGDVVLLDCGTCGRRTAHRPPAI